MLVKDLDVSKAFVFLSELKMLKELRIYFSFILSYRYSSATSQYISIKNVLNTRIEYRYRYGEGIKIKTSSENEKSD